jgi:hypothetical protein
MARFVYLLYIRIPLSATACPISNETHLRVTDNWETETLESGLSKTK